MSSRRATPSFLTESPAKSGSDRVLREDEFPTLWQHCEPLARWWIKHALRRVSLHRAATIAGARANAAHLLAWPEAVRGALRRDGAEKDDLLQEVAIELLRAIRRGKVHAAAPAVRGWFEVTVPRIVRRRVQAQAVLLFAAGAAQNGQEEDEHSSSVSEAVSELDTGDLAEAKLSLDQIGKLLGPRQLAVIQRRLEGDGYKAIATALGLTAGGVRALVFRALEALKSELASGESSALGAAAPSVAQRRRREAA